MANGFSLGQALRRFPVHETAGQQERKLSTCVKRG